MRPLLDALPRRPIRTTLLALCTALPLFGSRTAAANPRPLPFTYPYETLPEGEAEIEQYVDMAPLRAEDKEHPGGTVWEPAYKLQTEYEYGITDRLELGLYMQFVSDPGEALGFDGTKQRLRYRFAEAGEWPIDLAVYFEVAELHDEFELEEKVILARRFGKLRLMANLWVEQEWERYGGSPAIILNPTGGATFQVTPAVHLGAEYWMHAELEKDEAAQSPIDEFNDAPHHYVGPAVSLQFGKMWWSTAAYYRLDGSKRSVELGDKYGHAWVRTVIGLEL